VQIRAVKNSSCHSSLKVAYRSTTTKLYAVHKLTRLQRKKSMASLLRNEGYSTVFDRISISVCWAVAYVR